MVASPTIKRVLQGNPSNAAAGFDGVPVARTLAEGDELTVSQCVAFVRSLRVVR